LGSCTAGREVDDEVETGGARDGGGGRWSVAGTTRRRRMRETTIGEMAKCWWRKFI
jgi:hypothetical protein